MDMGNKPIVLSDNYRSGFLVRVKKVNGKINGVWLEISSHNDKLELTLSELSKLVKDLGLEEQVPLDAKTQPTQRYVCSKCGYTIPAFPEHPQVGRYFCPHCQLWQNFEKK